MAMVPWYELEEELVARNCAKVTAVGHSGFWLWIYDGKKRFSLGPPEEQANGERCYPDWMLDHLISTVGLPAERLEN